jgi:hypothetical protein
MKKAPPKRSFFYLAVLVELLEDESDGVAEGVLVPELELSELPELEGMLELLLLELSPEPMVPELPDVPLLPGVPVDAEEVLDGVELPPGGVITVVEAVLSDEGVAGAVADGGVVVLELELEVGGVVDDGAGLTTVDFSQATRPSTASKDASRVEYFILNLLNEERRAHNCAQEQGLLPPIRSGGTFHRLSEARPCSLYGVALYPKQWYGRCFARRCRPARSLLI